MLPFFLPLTYTFITHSALKLGTRYGCHIDNSSMKYESICCNIYDTEGFGYILVSVLYKHFAFFNIFALQICVCNE